MELNRTKSIVDQVTDGALSWRESSLVTDTYKMSMALGGRPEEKEVFYLSFRNMPRGRHMTVPIDLEEVVRDCIPTVTPETIQAEAAWLKSQGFPVSCDVLEAAVDASRVEVLFSIPQGEVVASREPVLTVRGPQALVSWLEPLIIGRVNFQMQLATEYIWACQTDNHEAFEQTVAKVTCQRQKELIHEAITGIHNGNTEDADYIYSRIEVDEWGYYDAVQAQAQKLMDVGVSPMRVFEVGMRAATCVEQHLIACKALQDMGFNLTSNTYAAWLLGMKPIGTLGHEGVMRWGGQDELAFRKHMEALPFVIMLLDTNDTISVGMETAVKLMKGHPDRNDGVRPDSGDLTEQFRAWVRKLSENDISPRPWVFEDGLDDESVAMYERLAQDEGYPLDKVWYGLGGYFVDRPEFTGYRRGRISMIYKLAWSEGYGATMKFGNEAEEGSSGKRSIPGIPVLAVKELGHGPDVMVCQHDYIPDGYRTYTEGDAFFRRTVSDRPALDGFTATLVEMCESHRESIINGNGG